jgi:hypothetical protein
VNEKAKRKAVIKTACIMGAVLLLVFGALTVTVGMLTKTGVFKVRRGGQEADFYQKLRLFDDVFTLSAGSGKPNHSHLTNLIKALDESAAGAEARLLVLKRYRKLARVYPEYREGYRNMAERAAEKFPHAALIAALAVEAGMDSDKPEEAKKLKDTALLLSENGPLSELAFLPLAFCMYALSGSLNDIDSAASVKRVDDLYAAFIESLRAADDSPFNSGLRESMLVDAALIKIVKQEDASAILTRLDDVTRDRTLDFMANYAYDFSNPLFAAEIWSRLGGEKDLANAASALYLAGESEKARNLWLLLIKKNNNEAENEEARSLKILYNLALTSENIAEKNSYLESLLAGAEDNDENHDVIIAGLIMYTRLQSEERARAILAEHPLTKQEPLLDLESIDRLLASTPPERSIGETWLLLNRHPDSPELYRWAAWYFEYQRRYEELEALHRFAARHRLENPYLSFHKALGFMRNEQIKEGAELLESIDEIPAWQRYANLALIFDARHEYAAALRYYENAAAEIFPAGLAAGLNDIPREAAAQIYFKMARCRRILGGKTEDIRHDLERAYALDHENIDIRLALRKLES